MNPRGVLALILFSSFAPAIGEEVTFESHPYRVVNGQAYDLSGAIAWLESMPSDENPYSKDTPMYQNYERRRQSHKIQGMRWEKYFIRDTVSARDLPEGKLFGIHVKKTVQRGTFKNGNVTMPKYVTETFTEHILLKNAPDKLQKKPAILAIPIGSTALEGAFVKTFDYGMPISPESRTKSLDGGGNLVVASDSKEPGAQSKSPQFQVEPGKEGASSARLAGRYVTGITKVSVLGGGRIMVIYEGGGSTVDATELNDDFLESWGITKSD